MPEKLCKVTVIDCYGVRRSIEIMAASTYSAASYFDGLARGSPSENLPRPNADTIYEVQIVGERTIHRVSHKKMLAWANGEAAKSVRRQNS